MALVAFDGFSAVDVSGPMEVFGCADQLVRQRGAHLPGYACVVTGLRRRGIQSDNGLIVVPDFALGRVGPVDTLLVAGGAGAHRASSDEALKRAIGRAAGHARRVASICTGAFVLAAAGLLDGRRATTHWAFGADLRNARPEVRVEQDRIYVRDGTVWTSGGMMSGIDLALAMVEEDCGRDLALEVARWMVVFVRRASGQSQLSAQLAVQGAERAPLRELQNWIAEHPNTTLDVPSLAKRLGMSVRNFSRVFRSEIGMSPATYVERVRVETARRLLETRRHSVAEVAAAAGFSTPETMRRSFSSLLGQSPREYRAQIATSRG